MKRSATLGILFLTMVGVASTLKAASTPVAVDGSLNAVIVSPNPWRTDLHAGKSITFDHLPASATVRIFTVSGREVQNLTSSNGTASWDRTNRSGEHVASGIYLYVVKDNQGNLNRGKLAVIN